MTAMGKRSAKPDVLGYLNERVDDLRRLVPRALRTSDADAIHQARVATRRLKSAIDLLQPVIPVETSTEFAAALKKLRRALGPLRDIDVMSDHLAVLQKQKPLAAPTAWLIPLLQSRRGDLKRRAARKAPVMEVLKSLGTWWAIEQELKEARQAEQSLVRRAVPRQLQSFARRADRIVESRAGGDAAGEQEDVHELRIDGKLLRYTLELAIPIGFDLPAPLFRSFKRLQEALGLWHDSVVLGEQCLRAALDTELPLHNPRLYGQVLELAERCWRESEIQLNRFARLWSKTGASMQAEILDVIRIRKDAVGERREELSVVLASNVS